MYARMRDAPGWRGVLYAQRLERRTTTLRPCSAWARRMSTVPPTNGLV